MLDWLKNVHRKGRAPEHVEQEMSRQDHYLTENGYEVPDPTPMAPPVGYKKTPSMVDTIRDMVRSEHLRQEAARAGFESFEDSEDFGEDDDDRLPTTAYESVFDPAEPNPPSDGPPATPPAAPSDGSPQGGPAGPTGPAPESPNPPPAAPAPSK